MVEVVQLGFCAVIFYRHGVFLSLNNGANCYFETVLYVNLTHALSNWFNLKTGVNLQNSENTQHDMKVQLVTPQNVIIAAKCNTNAKCNNNRRKT